MSVAPCFCYRLPYTALMPPAFVMPALCRQREYAPVATLLLLIYVTALLRAPRVTLHMLRAYVTVDDTGVTPMPRDYAACHATRCFCRFRLRQMLIRHRCHFAMRLTLLLFRFAMLILPLATAFDTLPRLMRHIDVCCLICHFAAAFISPRCRRLLMMLLRYRLLR